ncbi:MAG: hypothetical protein F6K47_09895 [Symploca sp. SIO2E6]|nr:hypothetical protein [Symploca sp. SIO2E6]
MPETIQVKRCSHDTDIVYSCAIALKLAPVLQLRAIDIAHQLMNAFKEGNRELGELGEKNWSWELGVTNTQQITLNNLNFRVEVVSSGWIYFRLEEESLATYLQQLISWRDRERGSGGEGVRGDSEHLFPIQYAHARCCSLLRLAHRQGVIKLSDANGTTYNGEWDRSSSNSPKTDKNPNSQFPIPNSQFPILNSQFSMLLVHPAERHLIAQIVDVQDALSNHSQLQGVKLAGELSQAFEQFYRSCRIWGEVKSQTPKVAQARLGLVAVTRVLLRSLLEEHLSTFAPVEL